MTLIISYILGVVTVFFIGVAVGMFRVIHKNNKMSKEIDSINLELSLLSKDVYDQIEKVSGDLDRTVSDLNRDIHSSMDSRFDKFERRLTSKPNSKNLIVD
jgi:hypothetical protein